MPARKRKRREHTHNWQEIQHYTLWPEQEVYERLRPIVLFGETAAARAKETGATSAHCTTKPDSLSKRAWPACFTKSARNHLRQGAISTRDVSIDRQSEGEGIFWL